MSHLTQLFANNKDAERNTHNSTNKNIVSFLYKTNKKALSDLYKRFGPDLFSGARLLSKDPQSDGLPDFAHSGAVWGFASSRTYLQDVLGFL